MLGLRRSRGSVLALVAMAAGLMAFTLYMKRIHSCPPPVESAAAASGGTEIKVSHSNHRVSPLRRPASARDRRSRETPRCTPAQQYGARQAFEVWKAAVASSSGI